MRYIAKKVDRIIVNSEWLYVFHDSCVEFGGHSESDHCPGILWLSKSIYSPHKPFRFFNYLSVITFFIGTMLFIPVFIEYLRTNLVPKMPTLIISVFFYLATVLSFFSGLILQTIVDKSKQDFEINFNNWEDKFKELKK